MCSHMPDTTRLMAKPAKRPIGELVDALGATRAEIAALRHRVAELETAILARRVGEAEGALYRMALVSATRYILDTAKLRIELGEDEYDNRCSMRTTVSLRVTPRPDALMRAAA